MELETSVNPDYWRSLQVQVFDPAAFIAAVHDKYADTNGGASIEVLQRQWDATMAMPPGGDPSVCPYHPGIPRFALMEVWHKATEFWRAGYRSGDKLFSDQYGHAMWEWMLKETHPQTHPVMEGSEPAAPAEAVQLELFF